MHSNTAEFTFKKRGKTVGTASRTVSKDGKTLTARQNEPNAKGGKSQNELVFDKK